MLSHRKSHKAEYTGNGFDMALLGGKGLFLKITFFHAIVPLLPGPEAHNGRQCFELMHPLGSHTLCNIGYKLDYE